jgi:hypothetical protein
VLRSYHNGASYAAAERLAGYEEPLQVVVLKGFAFQVFAARSVGDQAKAEPDGRRLGINHKLNPRSRVTSGLLMT